MLWRTEREGLAGRAGCGPGQPLPRGGKAGGCAPGPPARSLCSFARSLPPAGGLVVSQSVRLQPAGPASRRGPSLGRPLLLLPLFVWRLRRRAREARAPEPPVRLGCGGARAELGWREVGGAELSPRGRSWRPRRRRRLFVSSPSAGPGRGAQAARPPESPLCNPATEGLEPGRSRPEEEIRPGWRWRGAFKS